MSMSMEEHITIMQGDEYDIRLILKDLDGEPITEQGVSLIEVSLGDQFWSTADGSVTYDSENGYFVFRLESDESEDMAGGIAKFQIHVEFDNDDAVGADLPFAFVIKKVKRPVVPST